MQLKTRIAALWLYDLNRQSKAGLNLYLDLFNGKGPYLITCIVVFLTRNVNGGGEKVTQGREVKACRNVSHAKYDHHFPSFLSYG